MTPSGTPTARAVTAQPVSGGVLAAVRTSATSSENEAEVEHRVDAAEQVIGGHVVLEPEPKEQRLLPR